MYIHCVKIILGEWVESTFTADVMLQPCNNWVTRFLMAHQHNWAIQCHLRRYTLENTGQKTNQKQDTTKTKHNPEKASTKHSNKTSLVLVPFYHTRPGCSGADTGQPTTSHPQPVITLFRLCVIILWWKQHEALSILRDSFISGMHH